MRVNVVFVGSEFAYFEFETLDDIIAFLDNLEGVPHTVSFKTKNSYAAVSTSHILYAEIAQEFEDDDSDE